jgi:phosphoribosyl 1,2-cyclic phosphodiesterase
VAVSGLPDQLVILDAGSGIRLLGTQLARVATSAMNLDILLSHTHWDHIQGLPFFQPRLSGAPEGAVRRSQDHGSRQRLV